MYWFMSILISGVKNIFDWTTRLIFHMYCTILVIRINRCCVCFFIFLYKSEKKYRNICALIYSKFIDKVNISLLVTIQRYISIFNINIYSETSNGERHDLTFYVKKYIYIKKKTTICIYKKWLMNLSIIYNKKFMIKKSTSLIINREKVYLHFHIILYIIWWTN